MKSGRGLEKKLTLILLAFAVIISAGIGNIGYRTYVDNTFARYRRMATSVWGLARELVDADDMKACLERGVKSAAYEKTQAALDRVKENLGVTYIYLFDMTPGGEALYYLTATNDQEKNAQKAGEKINSLGDKDRFPDDVTRQLSKVGGDSPLTEIVNRTQYGYMLGVYAPVTDSRGEKIGLLGVDFDMNEINATLTSYATTVAVNAAATALFFTALLIFFVRRNVTEPIKVIAEKASAFVGAERSENDLFAIKLHIEKKDEIGVLASSFEKMTEDLVKYISELTATVAARERIKSELDVARGIQAGMLPSLFPAFPHKSEFDLYASMTPAKEVGGDFYDFFMTDDSHVVLVIADVSGKGVPAALFMMVARTLIKREARLGDEPSYVLKRVNDTLCEGNSVCMFVTAFIAVYDTRTGLLKYANAGHNPPLIIKSLGEVRLLESPPSLVLAIDENARYVSREITIEPGDSLFLYTDGVTEAFNDKGELFSEARLTGAFAAKESERLPSAFPSPGRKSARDIVERVSDELQNFVGDAEQSDDITMLAFVRSQYISDQHVSDQHISDQHISE
ncbi:MAG: SpoIIE family protein phosphatase [Synergistaceae bacterium]|jgi:sigma-B regulation protein RsbU (phosphoserine phosphatase)|nr:SpoIIE family protein phosphatase [Synergistaceae bacterium]